MTADANGPDLAIVIPAFKARFLGEALASLVRQTDRRFIVYVGDDGSPENLAEIVDSFRERLPIRYCRFPENLGSQSLVQHWNRCVRLSHEKWVCLFSDDDVLSDNFVESFHHVLVHGGKVCDLYRSDMVIIGDTGKVGQVFPPTPDFETADEFLDAHVAGHRQTRAADHIFARSAFDRENGFVDFPLAYASDQASWIQFARYTGIRKIPDALLYWRFHEHSISSMNQSYRVKCMTALMRFAEWQREWSLEQRRTNPGIRLKPTRLWFYRAISAWREPIPADLRGPLARFVSEFWNDFQWLHVSGITILNCTWKMRNIACVHSAWSHLYKLRLRRLQSHRDSCDASS